MMDHLPSKTFFFGAIALKCVLAIFGIVGNLGAIIRSLTVKQSKNATDYLILNLAIADLTTCGTYYPIFVVEFGRILTGVEINQEIFCRLSIPLTSTAVASSILTLLAVTYDRYCFIVTPLKYPLVMTKKRVFVMIATIWLSASLLACFLVLFTGGSERRLNCSFNFTAAAFSLVVFVHIPTILVLYLHSVMFRVARNHRRKIAQQYGIACFVSQSGSTRHYRLSVQTRFARAFKSIKTFAIVAGVFVLCYIPCSTTLLVCPFLCENDCVPVELFILLGDLVSLSSVLNPYLYTLRRNTRKLRLSFNT